MDPEFIQELLRVSLMMRVREKFEEQENEKATTVFWQPWLNQDDGTKPYTKHTTKWKRERRQRPPEYPRKSDPKYSETFGADPSSPISYDLPVNATNSNGVKTSQIQPDSPLDMTVRQRGLPPSYAQTISNPGYRSSYRPSVIHNGVPPTREELPSGISMCDPIIDEHFRRSLGSDYHTVFRNNASKEKSPPKSPPKVENSPTTSVIELMDSTGLSVDDHFAKALGDTWAKLNRKEPEMKTSSSENGLVSI